MEMTIDGPPINCQEVCAEIEAMLEGWQEEIMHSNDRATALASHLSPETREHLRGCKNCQGFLEQQITEYAS